MTTCSNCHAPLRNATDTFGNLHYPLCQACWLEIESEDNLYDNYDFSCSRYPFVWPLHAVEKPFTKGYEESL